MVNFAAVHDRLDRLEAGEAAVQTCVAAVQRSVSTLDDKLGRLFGDLETRLANLEAAQLGGPVKVEGWEIHQAALAEIEALRKKLQDDLDHERNAHRKHEQCIVDQREEWKERALDAEADVEELTKERDEFKAQVEASLRAGHGVVDWNAVELRKERNEWKARAEMAEAEAGDLAKDNVALRHKLHKAQEALA